MSLNIVSLHTNNPDALENALVKSCDGDHFIILDPRGERRAKRAFSCSLIPCVGDTVLVAPLASGECYIIAILERHQSEDAVLRFPKHVRIEAPNGCLTLAAQQKASLLAGERTEILSPETRLSTLKLSGSIQEADVSGQRWDAQINKLRIAAQTVETFADRMLHRLKNAFRVVEETDHSNVGQSIQLVQKTLSVRAREAMVTAKNDLRFDADRIHMG